MQEDDSPTDKGVKLEGLGDDARSPMEGPGGDDIAPLASPSSPAPGQQPGIRSGTSDFFVFVAGQTAWEFILKGMILREI